MTNIELKTYLDERLDKIENMVKWCNCREVGVDMIQLVSDTPVFCKMCHKERPSITETEHKEGMQKVYAVMEARGPVNQPNLIERLFDFIS